MGRCQQPPAVDILLFGKILYIVCYLEDVNSHQLLIFSQFNSHPAVKPGKYCILCVIRAQLKNSLIQLKNSLIADAVIPVKKSQKKKKNKCEFLRITNRVSFVSNESQ